MVNSPLPCSAEVLSSQRSAATQRLKVSLLVSDLSSRGAGRWGGAVRPFLLAQALRLGGYDVEMVGFTDGDPPPIADAPPLHTVTLGPTRNPMRAAIALMGKLQGDIIYAYKLKPSSFGLALLNRWFTRKPVVLDIDDWELSWYGGDRWRYSVRPRQLARDLLKPQGELRQLDHPLYLKWMEGRVPLADQVTTHTSFMQARFGGLYLPNGKDTDLFNPDPYDPDTCRAELGLGAYRVLMFPGAPRPFKGVEDILAALELIDEPDLKLVIVGGSPYDDYDHQLRARWGDRLIQLPKTPYQQMPRLIAAAHIIVVPQRDHDSARSQFPLKLTDGMAMAKPILTTRVGDIPGILDDTGYVVDPEAPAQLAQAIRQIFSHYDQALARGRQARRRCIDQYSIATMAARLQTILQPLTPETLRRRPMD